MTLCKVCALKVFTLDADRHSWCEALDDPGSGPWAVRVAGTSGVVTEHPTYNGALRRLRQVLSGLVEGLTVQVFDSTPMIVAKATAPSREVRRNLA